MSGRLILRAAAQLIAAALLAGHISAAQVVVPDEAMCGSCRIELRNPVRIGGFDGPGYLPGIPGAMATDTKGRFWLTFGDEVPMIFDADGQYLRRLGRRGPGPGEFRRPAALVSVGDSIVILDPGNARAVVVGTELTVARESRLPGQILSAAPFDWPGTVRRPARFETQSTRPIGTPATPPDPSIRSIQLDEAGRIWVFASVPAETWRQAWPRLSPEVREISIRALNVNKLFDTMIEVIDPVSRHLVAATRVPGYVWHALPGPRAVHYAVDDEGAPILFVSDVVLGGDTGPGRAPARPSSR